MIGPALLASMPPPLAIDAFDAASYDRMMFLFEVIRVLFVMAFGACIGSLLNVLVYRLPLGLGVVTPPSSCPACETRLTWRENIPIFGWLFLGGRCRFCGVRISSEYPLVELFTAVLFAVVYLVLYAEGGRFLNVPFMAVQPEWARAGFVATWPTFVLIVVLFSCLIAMTLVDARTFQIPMALTTAPALLAAVVHPAHALWLEFGKGGFPWAAQGWSWTMATPGPHGWWWIGASIGGAAGLLLSNILLWTGKAKRSFADYDAWEREQLAKVPATEGEPAAGANTTGEDPTHMWIAYPHARREVLREVLFLAPAIGLGLLGAAVAARYAGPWTFDPVQLATVPTREAPLWLDVTAGMLMGYLVGGGIVWAVRILGSLAFGKEAMGLGDVHLMAAVGACLGWVDAVLGFFAATFVGVFWAVLGWVLGGAFKRAMPFGPFLAVGSVLVWLLKPLVERGLGAMWGMPGGVNLP